MKKSLIIILLLTLNILTAFSQDINTENQKIISDFIACVKQQNREELSNKIAFPFKRDYPLPPIKNRQEFLNRFNEVFDDSLIKMIVVSKPDRDWSEMGWRGLMLHNGQVWLDGNGRLIAVNYQTVTEREKKSHLITQEKNLLHASIKAFRQPVCVLETKKFRIRIDDMGNGNYRYASWSLKNSMSDKPDLVIENGEFIAEGTGGNHRFEFKNEDYVYSCSITVLGQKDDPPALLTIFKADKEILSQPASIVER